MKPNVSTRKVLLLAISALSLCAFVYLNTVNDRIAIAHTIGINAEKLKQVQHNDEEEESTMKRFEGDYWSNASGAKRAFEFMKKFLPASYF